MDNATKGTSLNYITPPLLKRYKKILTQYIETTNVPHGMLGDSEKKCGQTAKRVVRK